MSTAFSFVFEHPIVFLFFVANLLIAIWSHSKAKVSTFTDYATASRSLPTGVLMMTLLATRLGSVDLANAGFVFEYGLIEGLMSVAFIFSFFFTGAFIAPFFVYFEGCMTLGDIMGKLYGRTVKIVTGFLSCIFSIMVITAQIKAVGVICGHLIDIAPHNAILWCGIGVLLYSVWGDMRSVSYTDTLQVMIALVVLMFTAQSLVQMVGGGGALLSSLPEEKLRFVGHPIFYYKIKSIFFWGLFPTFILTPPIVQRMLLAQNKRQVRKMWYVGALLYGLIRLLIMLIGLSAIIGAKKLGLDGSSKELLPRIIKELFTGQGTMKDLMCIGLLGVLLSTMDSYLHAIGVVMVQDIMIPLRRVIGKRALSPQRKATYARIGVGLVGIISIMMGFFGKIEFEDIAMHRMAVLLFNLVLIPFLIGLVGVKTSTASWVNFCIGYLFSIGLFYIWGRDVYACFLVGVMVGLIAFFLTHYAQNRSLVMLRRSKRTIAEQLWLPSREQLMEKLRYWLLSPARLPALARKQMAYHPSKSLAFSLFVFGFYTLSSITTGVSKEGFSIASFMGIVHIIGLVLCCGLIFEKLWPLRVKRYFALYWHLTLLYCLPFGGTLLFLKAAQGYLPVIQLLLVCLCLLALVSTSTFIVLSVIGIGIASKLYSGSIFALPVALWQEIQSDVMLYTICFIGISLLVFKYMHDQYIYRKGYFSHIATRQIDHEVRDPLAHISGLGHVLERATIDGKVMKDSKGKEGFWFSKERYTFLEKYAGNIVKQSKEIGEGLHQFSDIIKLQLLGAFVEKEVGVRALVEEAIEKLPEKYRSKIHVSMECLADFETKVLAAVFPNVIFHLVKNAYWHGGASEVTIKIDGKRRLVHVRDNGCGIAPEVLPRVFDLFYKTGESSGVGLSLVAMIIEASGGKVSCYSKHGGKKTFTDVVIELP